MNCTIQLPPLALLSKLPVPMAKDPWTYKRRRRAKKKNPNTLVPVKIMEAPVISETPSPSEPMPDPGITEIKTEVTEPPANYSGYSHSTSLLPAVPRSVAGADCGGNLEDINHFTHSVSESNEVDKVSDISLSIKKEVPQETDIATDSINDVRNDQSLHTSSGIQVNNKPVNHDLGTVYDVSKNRNIKTELVETCHETEKHFSSDIANNLSRSGNQPATATNSITTDNSESFPVANNVSNTSSHSLNFNSSGNETCLSGIESIKKEAVEPFSETCQTENANHCEMIKHPEKSSVEVEEIFEASNKIKHESDLNYPEIEIVEPVKKIVPLIDLTDDHSGNSTRCSSPVDVTIEQISVKKELTSAANKLETWKTHSSDGASSSQFCTVIDNCEPRQIFPTPMLKYLNVNRVLNTSIISKLKDFLKNLQIKTSDHPSTSNFEAGEVGKNSSVFRLPVNNMDISHPHLPMKRFMVDSESGNVAKKLSKSFEIRTEDPTSDIYPLKPPADPRTNQSVSCNRSVSQIPRACTPPANTAKVSNYTNSLLPGAVNSAECLKDANLFNNLKLAVKTIASPRKIIAGADCSIVPMEIEDNANTQAYFSNDTEPTNLTNSIKTAFFSSNYATDYIRSSNSAESSVTASRHINHILNEAGMSQNVERCYSTESITSSTEQSDNCETPPKRLKTNDFQEKSQAQGTKKIDINEYRRKKLVTPRMDNVSPLATQSNMPAYALDYVQYPYPSHIPCTNEMFSGFTNTPFANASYAPIPAFHSQPIFSSSQQNLATFPLLTSGNRITNIPESIGTNRASSIGQTNCTSEISSLSNTSSPVERLIPPPSVLTKVPPPLGPIHLLPPHLILPSGPPASGYLNRGNNYQCFSSTSSNPTNHQKKEPGNLCYPERDVECSRNTSSPSSSQFALDVSHRSAAINSSQTTTENSRGSNDVSFNRFYSSPGSRDGVPSRPPLPPEQTPPPLPPAEEISTNILSSPGNYVVPYYQPNRSLLNPVSLNRKHMSTSYSKAVDKKGMSLLPSSLKADVGKKYIDTSAVYLIIIEWNVDWISEIEKQHTEPPISSVFQQVKNSYSIPLDYYNTYFPLLLLECWNKIAVALKRNKDSRKTHEWFCQIHQYERKPDFINISCSAIIPKSDVESIPKDGNVILVQMPLTTVGSMKMLAYVHSSEHRAFSIKHDHAHKTLKNLKHKMGNLSKIKISFYIAFSADFARDELIRLYKLTNIKNFLKQNDALKNLSKSRLSKIILNPLDHRIVQIQLPDRKDFALVRDAVQQLVENVQTPNEQIILVQYMYNSDPLMAMFYLAEELKKSESRPKTLICVEHDMLESAGNTFLDMETFVILNRERDLFLHDRLKPFCFERIVEENYKRLGDDTDSEIAYLKALQCDVILAPTTNCFYDDISALLSNKMNLDICIIHQAHLFTEAESILPLQYGIKKLILIGDSETPCKVGSRTAMSYEYTKSLFHRVHSFS